MWLLLIIVALASASCGTPAPGAQRPAGGTGGDGGAGGAGGDADCWLEGEERVLGRSIAFGIDDAWVATWGAAGEDPLEVVFTSSCRRETLTPSGFGIGILGGKYIYASTATGQILAWDPASDTSLVLASDLTTVDFQIGRWSLVSTGAEDGDRLLFEPGGTAGLEPFVSVSPSTGESTQLLGAGAYLDLNARAGPWVQAHYNGGEQLVNVLSGDVRRLNGAGVSRDVLGFTEKRAVFLASSGTTQQHIVVVDVATGKETLRLLAPDPGWYVAGENLTGAMRFYESQGAVSVEWTYLDGGYRKPLGSHPWVDSGRRWVIFEQSDGPAAHDAYNVDDGKALVFTCYQRSQALEVDVPAPMAPSALVLACNSVLLDPQSGLIPLPLALSFATLVPGTRVLFGIADQDAYRFDLDTRALTYLGTYAGSDYPAHYALAWEGSYVQTDLATGNSRGVLGSMPHAATRISSVLAAFNDTDVPTGEPQPWHVVRLPPWP